MDIKHSDEIESEALVEVRKALAALHTVHFYFDGAEENLANTTGWSGSTRDVCEDAHRAVRRYEDEVYAVCGQLRDMLEGLNQNVAGFSYV